jgi:hypothetical protein
MKHIKTFSKFSLNESKSYNEAVVMTKEEFINFLEDNYFVYPHVPYFGTPEVKLEYIETNFTEGEAAIELTPPVGSTIIEKENNILYFITNDVLYKVENVSEKEYNDIYNEYVYPTDYSNPESPIHLEEEGENNE